MGLQIQAERQIKRTYMPYPTAGPPHLKHLQHLSAAHWIPHPASARLHPSGFHLLPEPEAATPTGTVPGCCWQCWGRNQLSQTHPLGHPLLLLRTEKHPHAAEVTTILPGRKGAVTFNSPSKHKQRGRAPKTTPYSSDTAQGTPEAAPVCATQQGDEPLLRARGKLANSGGVSKDASVQSLWQSEHHCLGRQLSAALWVAWAPTPPSAPPLYQCSRPFPTNIKCFSARGHPSPHYNPKASNETGGRPYESLYQVSLRKRRGKAH